MSNGRNSRLAGSSYQIKNEPRSIDFYYYDLLPNEVRRLIRDFSTALSAREMHKFYKSPIFFQVAKLEEAKEIAAFADQYKKETGYSYSFTEAKGSIQRSGQAIPQPRHRNKTRGYSVAELFGRMGKR